MARLVKCFSKLVKISSFKESLNLYLFEKSKKLIKVQKKILKTKAFYGLKILMK